MNQSPQPTLIPTFSGVNYAPLEPLVRAQDSTQNIAHKVIDALKEKWQHFSKQEDRAWNSIYRMGQMVASFEAGDQIPITNPFTGGALIVRPNKSDDSTTRALNDMNFYATKCRQMWMSSKPNVTVVPGRRIDSAMMAARGGNALVDFYEEKFYDSWFELREGDFARTFGTYITRFRWDMGVQGLMAVREIVENKTLDFAGYGYCGDCQNIDKDTAFQSQIPQHDDQFPGSSEMAPLPTCPKCGSLSVAVQPGQQKQVSNVVGTERQNLGDLVCEQLPLTGCRFDLYKRPEESSWFIVKQRVTEGQIRALVGQIKLSGKGDNGDTGLDVERLLAHSGQAMGGKSDTVYGANQRSLDKKTATLEEMWLSASDVQDIVLGGDEKSVSGQPIPKGRLSELCPNGLVVVGVNGMSTILGIYQESHKDLIVSGVYHPRTMSGAGRGAVDSVEVQRRKNVMDSQQMVYLRSSATPAYVYRPEAIASEEIGYLGHPSTNLPLKDLPTGMSIKEVAMPLPPGQMAAGIVQYTQQWLNNQAQIASLCTEFSGALPGVDNKTAHGAELAASLAQSLFSPMLLIKAYTRKRGAEIMVALWRKHQVNPQYFPLSGKRSGRDGIWLKSADLDTDLLFKVEDGSEAAKTPLTRRLALASLAQGFGNLGAMVQSLDQFPKLVKPIITLSGLELYDDEEGDDVTSLCRQRFTQMQEAEKMGAPTPMDIVHAIDPAISELEPSQTECVEWWRQFLVTDDGQEASPLMRQAIEALIALQAQNEAQAQAMVAQLQGQVQQAAAQPAQDAQAQQQQAQAQQQAQLDAQNQPPPGQEQDPQEAAEIQSQQSAQDAAQSQAQSDQQHQQQVQQMGIKHAQDRTLLAAKHGQEAMKQAADHAHKERIAAIAAKHKASVKRW